MTMTMPMTFWNLLVVICFVVLYLGVTLVFIQVRRMREEMKVLAQGILNQIAEQKEASMIPMPSGDSQDTAETAQMCTHLLRRELGGVEERLLEGMKKATVEELLPEFEEIQREMRYMERGGGGGNRRSEPSTTVHGHGERAPLSKSDAYHEARLLLSNNVDEERVIEETGLTVEEVSLLKRLQAKNKK
ncbi:hypothetical protein ACQZV8_04595 [Magnetococcales bacterium HHB-1]